jgi:hypothetical protein
MCRCMIALYVKAFVAHLAVYSDDSNVGRRVNAAATEPLREGEDHQATVAASVHNAHTACSKQQ